MTKVITKQKAREVDAFCRARAGNPYVYGGRFTLNPKDSCDCSALVLQTAAFIMGREDWHTTRYGSTESFRLDHATVYDIGFKRLGSSLPAARAKLATLGFQPIMLVGLQHGGGGVYSHTACTLFYADTPGGEIKESKRGIDWESRGGNPGVFYYDGARAWNDGLFHDFWYLDAKLETTATSQTTTPLQTLVQATGVTQAKAASMLPTVQEGLRLSNCTTPRRIAYWLAQCGHESDGFATTTEYASGAAYEGRTDLGNTQPGDGVRFRGRGWIQCTGRVTYSKFSQWAHSQGLVTSPTYFVDRPTELADIKWAGISAAWYWTVARPQINNLCDAGDFIGVTKAINGGTNGLADRQARLARAEKLGDQLLALVTDTTDSEDDMTAPLESISLYATPGSTTRFTTAQFVQSIDGMVHRELVEREAMLGDTDALLRIARVAAGQGKYTHAAAVNHAKAVLAAIEQQHPEHLSTLANQIGA